jgi:hypothetical protein
MHDLFKMCRHEQVPVLMVLMPESTLFRSGYRAEGLTEAAEFVQELRDRHGMEIIDATNWVEDGLFVDGHHLDAPGARVFSDRLRDELKRFLARPPSEQTALVIPSRTRKSSSDSAALRERFDR